MFNQDTALKNEIIKAKSEIELLKERIKEQKQIIRGKNRAIQKIKKDKNKLLAKLKNKETSNKTPDNLSLLSFQYYKEESQK